MGSIETIHSEMESEEEGWEQTPQNGWDYKRLTNEETSECKYCSIDAKDDLFF